MLCGGRQSQDSLFLEGVEDTTAHINVCERVCVCVGRGRYGVCGGREYGVYRREYGVCVGGGREYGVWGEGGSMVYVGGGSMV